MIENYKMLRDTIAEIRNSHDQGIKLRKKFFILLSGEIEKGGRV